jgi:hypothetical protein
MIGYQRISMGSLGVGARVSGRGVMMGLIGYQRISMGTLGVGARMSGRG